MKIYDCFTFYNELDLLEIRLNELYEVVDKFVIVEANRSHQNKPKEYLFLANKDRYLKFLDKIIYVSVDGSNFCDDTWYNEKFQRSKIKEGLISADEDDIVFISDLDEIPSKEAVNFVVSKNLFPCCFWQVLHYYYLNTIVSQNGNELNSGTVAMTKSEFFKNTNACRDPSYKWANDVAQIKNSGWHFSFLGNANNMFNKIQNYAHSEYNNITEEESNNRISALKDPFERDDFKIRIENNLSYLPNYVVENIEKYLKYIKE